MVARKQALKVSSSVSNNTISNNEAWLKEEIAGCKFKDERLNKRFQALFGCLWKGIGKRVLSKLSPDLHLNPMSWI